MILFIDSFSIGPNNFVNDVLRFFIKYFYDELFLQTSMDIQTHTRIDAMESIGLQVVSIFS